MARMTQRAEDLVRAGREALRPSDADRERIFQALVPQIGGPAPGEGVNAPASPSPSATPSASAAATSTLVKTLTVVVGLSVATAGLFVALRPAPMPGGAAPATAPPAVPVPVNDLPESVVSPVPAEPVKKPSVSSHGVESLAQEVAILSRASADLHAGRPAVALAALAEHQRKFPAGVLTEERTAAQAQALCALGRAEEAKAALARLARTAPRSPHEVRARKACEAVLTGGE